MPRQISFSVPFDDLKQRVNFVRNGLGSSKTDLPVMLVRMNLIGSKLTMFASNKEIFCRTSIKVESSEDGSDGSFSVLGQKLVNLLSTAEAETAHFKIDDENMEVSVGFLTVNLTLYDGAPLKQVENGVDEHLSLEGLPIDRSSFEEALICGKSCTSASSIRPDVTHVELRNGILLSSDGRKIMMYENPGFDKSLTFKCPASTISGVITGVKNISAESIQIAENDGYFFLKAGMNDFSMGIRKVERVFPAIEGTVNVEGKVQDEISVDKNVLEAALRGVALGLEADDVKVTVEAEGTGTDAVMEVSCKNSLGRKSFERLSIGRTGESPSSFPVSYKHLLDTTSIFKGDSVVDLYVAKELNLLKVVDQTDVRTVTTIIPFRTDAQIEAEKKEAAEKEAAKKEAEKDSASEVQLEEAVEAQSEDVDLD